MLSSLIKSLACLGGILITILSGAWIHLSSGELLFESEESIGNKGQAIFNRIRLETHGDKDIWMMQQSHQGLNSQYKTWDRVALVIDKSQSPKVASFYQLEPGSLTWTPQAKKIPLKAACFQCHSNGPRVIRPQWASQVAPLSLYDKMQTFTWNLRIKLYGRVVPDVQHQGLPFEKVDPQSRRVLQVKTCTLCHKDSGLLARGSLQWQHRGTIKSMVEKGHMPPPGFSLNENEREEIKRFIEAGL